MILREFAYNILIVCIIQVHLSLMKFTFLYSLPEILQDTACGICTNSHFTCQASPCHEVTGVLCSILLFSLLSPHCGVVNLDWVSLQGFTTRTFGTVLLLVLSVKVWHGNMCDAGLEEVNSDLE